MIYCKDKFEAINCQICCLECNKDDCLFRCEDAEGHCDWKEER